MLQSHILSQIVGAFLAAVVLHLLFSGILLQFESAHGIVRGAPGSELSAMVYGEYFPNPATAASLHWTDSTVRFVQAMLAEGIGTAFLAFFVFAVTDAKNRSGPGTRLLPVFIGLTVSILISVIAPLTQRAAAFPKDHPSDFAHHDLPCSERASRHPIFLRLRL